MTYTIKEVADKVGLSAYTLRFYDKQGLLPFVSRNESGYRAFTDGDLHLLHTIICLKNTGMAISAIANISVMSWQVPNRLHNDESC